MADLKFNKESKLMNIGKSKEGSDCWITFHKTKARRGGSRVRSYIYRTENAKGVVSAEELDMTSLPRSIAKSPLEWRKAAKEAWTKEFGEPQFTPNSDNRDRTSSAALPEDSTGKGRKRASIDTASDQGQAKRIKSKGASPSNSTLERPYVNPHDRVMTDPHMISAVHNFFHSFEPLTHKELVHVRNAMIAGQNLANTPDIRSLERMHDMLITVGRTASPLDAPEWNAILKQEGRAAKDSPKVHLLNMSDYSSPDEFLKDLLRPREDWGFPPWAINYSEEAQAVIDKALSMVDRLNARFGIPLP